MKAVWTGRILSGLAGAFLFAGAINLMFVRSADLREGFAHFGYPEASIFWIGAALLIASVLYLIPRTCVLGAILLTGYLGGAVATHARISDPVMFAPFTFGVVIWLALFLRDARLRALLPLRQA